MYGLTYRTKRGGSGSLTVPTFDALKREVIKRWKAKLPATAYYKGEVIGRVWEDSSERTGWNWQLREPIEINSPLQK